jgi:hypothetical protein
MITPVSVPVPFSGDGPVVDVSTLVGPKTVQLSGTYEGYYDLLGSQDGQTFVTVASFSAGGVEGIEQTIPGAFSAVRLRSGAVDAVGVVCEVSGVAGAGQNGFGVVASLSAGASGLTPIVDTSTFIPPTGSEADTCFLCRGSFTGPIIILGSVDGVEFNPVGSWNPGRLPPGASPSSAQEFTPVVTEAKVRYVRLQVSGTVTGSTIVTMGGRVPVSGSASGTNLSIVTSSALSAGYYFAGPQATGTTLTDTLGNTVNLTGGAADCVCVGSGNSVVPEYGETIVIGLDLVAGGADIINIGRHNACGDADPSSPNKGYNDILIGTSLSLPNYGTNNILVGQNLFTGVSGTTSFNIIVGNAFSPTGVGDTAFGNLILMPEGSTLDLTNSQYNVVLGSSNNLPANLNDCNIIGEVCYVATNGTASGNFLSLIGTFLTASMSQSSTGDFSAQVLIGLGITTENNNASAAKASKVVAIGDTITLQAAASADFTQVTLVGSSISATVETSVSDGSSHVVHVGDDITSGNTDGSGTGVSNVTVVGSSIALADGIQYVTAVGQGVTVGTSSYAVAVGYQAEVDNSSDYGIAVGYQAYVGSSYSMALGEQTSVSSTGSSAVGLQCVVESNAAGSWCGGDNSHIRSGSNNGFVLGNQVIIDQNSPNSIAIGSGSGGFTVGQDAPQTIAIGNGINIGTLSSPSNTPSCIGIGSTIAVDNGSSYSTAIGSNLNVGGGSDTSTTSTVSYSTMIGANLSVGGGVDGDSTTSVVAIGSNINVGVAGGVVAVGEGITISGVTGTAAADVIAIGFGIDLSGSDYTNGGIAVGNSAQIASGGYSIAIGTYATAVIGQCVIGANTGDGYQPIHEFTVCGYVGGNPVNTIDVIDDPASGCSGLSVVYYDGSTYSNKTLKAVSVSSISDLTGKLVTYLE